MRGITIELSTQCQSETYRVLDEVQLLVSLDGMLDIQLNGRSRHCYNHIALINNLDIVKISHAQSLIKVCIPMHFFSKYHTNHHNGYFNQDRFTSHTKVTSLLKRIIKDDKSKQSQALMYDILKILFEEAYVTTEDLYLPEMCVNNKLLSNILQYIYDHLDTRISLKILSDHFFVSQSYISILFSKYLDFSFKIFFITLKLGHSLQSVLTTNDTIQSIAIQYGFSNYSNYSKIFKTYIGVSPLDYRMQAEDTEAMLTVLPFDSEHFLSYLVADSLSVAPKNITIDLNDLVQPSYTHERQLFLTVSSMSIYEAVEYMMHSKDMRTNSNLTLYFQEVTAKDIRFTTTVELERFCHLIKKVHLAYAFQFYNMKQFETFDKVFLQPILNMMAMNPYTFAPEDLKLSLILTSEHLSIREIAFIKQHMAKHLPHCQIALALQSPFMSNELATIRTLHRQSMSFDFYCLSFEALVNTTLTNITMSHIEQDIERLQHHIEDTHTPIVLTGLSESIMERLWHTSVTSDATKFLNLLLYMPNAISGLSLSLISSAKQPIAYYNQQGHQLPYCYMNNMFQHFAGQLNNQTENYVLHDKEDAYLLLLLEPCCFHNNRESYSPQTTNYQILSAYTLATQLVVTYTYEDLFSNVTNGIARDIELYYLPSKDVELIHQTFQLQPHITVHNFFNKILHISLPPEQIKLIKIYKHKAMKKAQIL